MTLRTKVTLIVSSSFLALIALLLAADVLFGLGRFRSLESEDAHRNADRGRDALADQTANLQATAADWAHWDDSAAFVTGRNPAFVAANLADDTFTTLSLDIMAFVGADGKVVHLRAFDRVDHVTVRPPAGFTQAIAAGAPLVTFLDVNDHHEGVLSLPGSFLLAASQPITDSQKNPPATGALVFARVLDASAMARLSSVVQHPVRLSRVTEAGLSPRELARLAAPSDDSPPLVLVRGGNSIESVLPIWDITRQNALVLRVQNTRGIYLEGLRSLRYLAGSLIACCVVGAGLLFVLLSRMVLSPLGMLSRQVARIGRGGAERLSPTGPDELGALAGSINGMLDALSASENRRDQLEERLGHVHKLEAIGTLAGGVAHDFNNILMAIQGFCDLLDDSHPAGQPGRTEVEEIRRAVVSASSLTSQLLAFSRRQRLQFRAINLKALLSEMAGMLQRLLGGHLALELSLQPGLSPILGDVGQLQQVVLNLAANARDAMPGGGSLTISTAEAALTGSAAEQLGVTEGAYVRCAVSDTGIGMDEQVRRRIFDPFFTTKEPGRGTGLGLSVVWGIVKQSEGAISVTSQPDRGTTFEIYLPVASETALAEPREPHGPGKAVSIEVGPSAQSTGESPGTVLLVEDDPSIRRYLGAVLSKAGYRVVPASDGEEALQIAEVAEVGSIGLVLTDVVMPRMGGGVLARRLREKLPRARVLFMSGNAELLSAEAGLPPDATLLQKPFTARDLLNAVRAALSE